MRFVLFVCTGNSCRSVMAHAICQQLLAEKGLYGGDRNNKGDAAHQIYVLSAGVGAVEGMTATFETKSILRNAGMEITGHRARRLTAEMVQQAELIFVMEHGHTEAIVRKFPAVKDKVHMLRTFGLQQTADVPNATIMDPIGKPLEVYEVCYETVKAAVERVVEHLELSCESR
jgi:protein-tyrosine-phosphatase